MKKYSSIMRVNSHRTSAKKLKLGLFVIAAILGFGFIFPQIISGTAFVILYPVHLVSNWYQTSESVFPQYLRGRTEILAEMESLRSELANQTGTQLSISRLIDENMQLRSLVNLGTSTQRILAKVIAQPNVLTYDLLQIDKGSNDGIKVGAPVFIGIDSVIGVVVHTTPAYSFVDLITTPGFKATAYIVGPNIFAPLEGMGGGIARVRVPQGISISNGNLVLLPSAAAGVYGEIVTVENLPTQPEQFGYVTPALPLQGILFVSVASNVPPKKSEVEIDAVVREEVRDYFRFTIPTASSTISTSTEEQIDSNSPVL